MIVYARHKGLEMPLHSGYSMTEFISKVASVLMNEINNGCFVDIMLKRPNFYFLAIAYC